MLLLKFIDQESPGSYHQLAMMAVISGVANSLLLAIVNHAVDALVSGENLAQYFILYLITFVLFLYAQWFAFDRAILLIEEAIYKVRTRLSQKVQQVDLPFVEKVGTDLLYARLTQNDALISQAVPQLTAAAQMSMLVICSFIYLAIISPLSFLISLGAIVLGVSLFLTQSKEIKAALGVAKDHEAVYFRTISDMIHGFKEIKINRQKANDIVNSIDDVSAGAKTIKIAATRKEARMWGFGRVFIYALLPILVFIIPSFHEEHAAEIVKITSTMLFITGPITILVNMIPVIRRVNMAIQEVMDLEAEMDAASANEVTHDAVDFSDFKHLQITDASFAYPGNNTAFTAGPFNESVPQGELLFIIGGNGSGKSTFLKLLTGLYAPVSGNIEVDGVPIQHSNLMAYRNLFAVLFTDFHLFERLYGIDELTAKKVNYWLKKMKMQHKVSFKDGAFSTINLSTGQRKRLAFVAAMLEEKPILVIDEFAADQDPQFRQYFYEEVLPELKEMGKTVIAVTHDDHYFHVADRILKMEEGRLAPYTTPLLGQQAE